MRPSFNLRSYEKNQENIIKIQWLLAFLSIACIGVMFRAEISNSFENLRSFIPPNQPKSQQNYALPISGSKGLKSTNGVSDVVNNALAFKALLSTTQQATLEQSYTTLLARKWSNLPCGSSCRNGIQLGTNLTTEQYTAAMKVISAALGSGSSQGYDEYYEMNLAEAYLHVYNGTNNNYDSVLRWISFLGTPSTTGAWMLQFGGHHYAANIAFNNGHVIGATPFFMGLEPKTFTYNSVDYDPLGDEKNAFAAMLSSLSSTELSSAKLSSSFSDCVMSPGETNGGNATFPSASLGIACSSLSSAQQSLVLAAIQQYVQDMDATTASSVMTKYTNELSSTYISYTGNGTSGSASSFFIAQGDYVRISGPNVWIEFSCQSGVVVSNLIHYHTIWRDRTSDYGADLKGSAIDDGSTTTTSISSNLTNNKSLITYPNPTMNQISLELPQWVNKAFVTISDINGRTVYTDNDYSGEDLEINVSKFSNGKYFLNIRDKNHFYSSQFDKQ